ncbi:hypothetical protein [Terribacillus sp. JSM ZJ617]|uniref:hypothetical protein n=1 Tax=Terribacillus sp. JSM ZJ617 TaxID=3342119 RepID=UPI0035A9519B
MTYNGPSGIRDDDGKRGKFVGNRINGYDVGMYFNKSENHEVIENLISQSNADDPSHFVREILKNPDIMGEIQKAQEGEKKSITFLKGLADKLTTESVLIAYKLLLKSYNIEI